MHLNMQIIIALPRSYCPDTPALEHSSQMISFFVHFLLQFKTNSSCENVQIRKVTEQWPNMIAICNEPSKVILIRYVRKGKLIFFISNLKVRTSC